MKKLVYLAILLAMFASMVMAEDDEDATYSLTIKPTASIPSKLYNLDGNSFDIYPFIISYSIDKENKKTGIKECLKKET